MSNEKTVAGRTVAPIASNLDFVVSEAYNLLRTNLMLSFPEAEGGKAIGITSPAPQDGKSYTSINLSYALAKDGHKTLLVSADMRKPSVEKIIGVDNETGLSDILAGNADYDESVLPSKIHDNLFVLPSGTIPPMPSELLGSKKMTLLLSELKQKYEYIIFDLPPVLSVADPIILGSKIDGIVVVIRHLRSRKKNVEKVVSQLKYAGIKIVGFVYNAYKTGGKSYYRKNNYSSYGYRYYYKNDSGK